MVFSVDGKRGLGHLDHVEGNNSKPKQKMKDTNLSEIVRLGQEIAKIRAELNTATNRADVLFLRQELSALIYEQNIVNRFSVDP
jgi:hypothetical protein